MINFNYENNFSISNEEEIKQWLSNVILSENSTEKTINYIFCNDDYLHKLNLQFLSHDTLTDVISFDYSSGKTIQGDIFISTERVEENAKTYNTTFLEELYRVIVHGVLHFCGYKDKTEEEIKEMRTKENIYLEQIK